MSWSISVKTVGGVGSLSSSDASEGNFTVHVSPEDDLGALYSQIEGVTGLTASQQRLIYRGRLIGSSGVANSTAAPVANCVGEPKIKDISGLCDGQTIHLVRKRETEEPAETAPAAILNQNATGNSTSEAVSSFDNDEDGSSGAASLLAALLALGTDEDQNAANEMPDSLTRGRERQRQRNARQAGATSGRRSGYRLTAEDLVVPDPGSMEPVRQGLMTLHTMLPHAAVGEREGQRSRVEANRQWYRGQWIDCRDTVNQWLEATIVDIADPNVVLPPQGETVQCDIQQTSRPASRPTSEPAVSSMDWDGRRRLLLEPCDENDPENEGGELAGWRRRRNNEGVQLLLIHYNGWPHRWDEWIRSDSERIRPFRTRTRHPSMAPYASPTPQSVFNEAPPTFIRDEDEEADRAALLPELSRILGAVGNLVAAAARIPASDSPELNTRANNLPWVDRSFDNESSEDPLDPTDDDFLPNGYWGDTPRNDSSYPSNTTTGRGQMSAGQILNVILSRGNCGLNRRQLEMLAPILDRLGRVLTDAAPHVASLASTLPRADGDPYGDSTDPEANTDHSNSLSGIFSLLSRDRRRPLTADTTGSQHNSSEHQTSSDPDLQDFATGLVNTHRGEVRGGPRTRQEDGPGLLGAYLAAASLGSVANDDADNNNTDGGNNFQGLGRLFRDRNGGAGNGIDIHIHAIVTTPGVTGGAFGLGGATLNDLSSPNPVAGLTTRGLFANARRTTGLLTRNTATSQQEDEDLGLFSDLYSENPPPVNLTGGLRPGGFNFSDSRAEDGMASDDAMSARFSASRGSPVAMAHADSMGLSSMRLSGLPPPRRNSGMRGTSWSSASQSPPRDRSSSPTRRGTTFGRLLRRLGRRSNT